MGFKEIEQARRKVFKPPNSIWGFNREFGESPGPPTPSEKWAKLPECEETPPLSIALVTSLAGPPI